MVCTPTNPPSWTAQLICKPRMKQACLLHGIARRQGFRRVAESEFELGKVGDAHRGEVRCDAEVCLCATLGNTEAGHHLVKAEQRAMIGAQRSQPLRHNVYMSGQESAFPN